MEKKNIEQEEESRVCFDDLEDWVRGKIQYWIQELLEEEVREHLGRDRHERRKEIDAVQGYRNGYGKERRMTLSCGTIRVRRPRVRDLEEGFESRVLPLFAKRTATVRDLIPELYLHGLAQGDFDLALRGLLGDGAALSASTVARLKEKWQAELEVWQSRPLDDLEVAYMWADGVVRHEALCNLVGMQRPTLDLSQQVDEAGSSLILEVQERAGAAPTTTVQIGTTRQSETGKQDGKV